MNEETKEFFLDGQEKTSNSNIYLDLSRSTLLKLLKFYINDNFLITLPELEDYETTVNCLVDLVVADSINVKKSELSMSEVGNVVHTYVIKNLSPPSIETFELNMKENFNLTTSFANAILNEMVLVSLMETLKNEKEF